MGALLWRFEIFSCSTCTPFFACRGDNDTYCEEGN